MKFLIGLIATVTIYAANTPGGAKALHDKTGLPLLKGVFTYMKSSPDRWDRFNHKLTGASSLAAPTTTIKK